MSNFNVDASTILLVRGGSRAYGTSTPTSDLDIKGICIEPIDHMIGFLHNFEQRERSVAKGDPHDEVIYSLRKFAKLAADCNPNIIEVLFVEEEDILASTALGRELIEARDVFLSKKARFTFSGYAFSQLKRIKSHRAWTEDPPKGPPSRSEFGLSETSKISKGELATLEALLSGGIEAELSQDVQLLFAQEKRYQAAKARWEGYKKWIEERNPIRAELERRCGYDSKHGMHLIRLMRMCKEILNGDGVLVRRPDAQELLEVRNGGWSYERLIEEAERLESECEHLYLVSSLPKAPDRVRINEIVIYLTKRFHGGVS